MVIALNKCSRTASLKIIMQKIKVMTKNIATAQGFEIDGEAVEVVNEYIYLGQVLTPDPHHYADTIRRIRTG